MDAASTPTKVAGRLESLSKEELLKFLKKQALNSKELKKKIEDISTQLKNEQDEVSRLEKEKKDWISRGVSAEFEKKDSVVKKNKELELAAQLGKEMLAENDELTSEIEDLKKEHDDTIQSFEDELDKVIQEKEMLERTLQAIQEEYKAAKEEAQECRVALQASTEIHEKDVASLIEENKDFREKVRDLEHQLNASSANLKLRKLKEKYEEVMKETKVNKEAYTQAEKESKSKSEQMVMLDTQMKNLRNDILEHQKQQKADLFEIESLNVLNDELRQCLEKVEDKNQELDEELQRVKGEKEKQLKSLRNLKTKTERGIQMEEELKKQLNIIVSERDDLLKKLQKKNQQRIKGKIKSPREDELEKDVVEKSKVLKELEDHISVLESDNTALQIRLKNFSESNNELHERYQNLQKDFESLNFEIDELTASINIAREENQQAVAKNEELMEENKHAVAKNKELLEDNKFLQEKYESILIEKDSVITQREIIEADLKTMKDKCKKMNEKNEQLTTSNKNLSSKATKLEDEKKKLVKGGKNKKPMKKDAKSPVKTAKSTDVDQSVQCQLVDEETKGTIVKLETRVDELLNQLQTLNEEKHNQESELEDLFKLHDDLQLKYDFECQERQKKENELHYLEGRIMEMESTQKENESSNMNTSKEDDEKYREEILKKDSTIQTLQNEIDVLQHQQLEINAASNKEVDTIFQEFAHLDQQFNFTKKELEETLNAKQELQQSIIALEQEKTRAVETLSVTAQRLLEMKKSLDERNEELEILQQQQIVQTERDDMSTLKTRIDELSTKATLNEELEASNKELKKEVSVLKNDIQQIESNYKTLYEENSTLKASIERMLNMKTELKSRLEDLKEKFLLSEKQICDLNETIEYFNALKVKCNCGTKEDFKTFIESVVLESKVHAGSITEMTEKLNILETGKMQLHGSVAQIEEKYKVQCNMNKEQKVLLSNKQNEFVSLQNEFKNFHKEKINFEETISILQDNLNEKESEINLLRQEMVELTSTKPLHESKLLELKEAITSKDDIINDITNQINEQNMKLSLSGGSDEKLLNELKEKNAELLECHKEIDELRGKLNESCSKLNTMRTTEENHINEIYEKQAIICDLNDKVKQIESHQENMKKEKSDTIEEHHIELEKQREEKINMTEIFQKELDQQKALVTKLKNEIVELTETNSLMENENRVLTDEFNHKVNGYVKLQGIIEEKSQLLDSLKQSVNEQSDQYQIIEEFEQLKIDYQKVEDELQSALNKVDELELELKNNATTKTVMKEKDEKVQKFRHIAIKAKKELESLRVQYNEEKIAFEQQIESLMEDGKLLKNDLVRQKTECAKHEEEFEEMQREIKCLQNQLMSETDLPKKLKEENEKIQAKLEEVLLKLSTAENSFSEINTHLKQSEDEKGDLSEKWKTTQEQLLESNESLNDKNEELKKLKLDLNELQKNLDSTQKDTQQLNMMNLEIDDYHRTVENLQSKTTEQDKIIIELNTIIEGLKREQEELKEKNLHLKKETNGLSERGRKLKTMILKLKKEVSEEKTKCQDYEITIEELKQNNDSMKLEVSQLISEKTNLTNQSKSTIDLNEKMYQSLEVKYARVSNDLVTLKTFHTELQDEYEHYKVRAHNVLKQQKAMQVDSEKEIENIERKRLEGLSDELKMKLQETAQRFNLLQCEHDELELEHERLQTRHNQFVHEITEKEHGWKDRFEQIRNEKDIKALEYEDKIKVLKREIEDLTRASMEHSDRIQSEREGHGSEISLLKEEINRLQQRIRTPPPPRMLELHKQDSRESIKNDHLLLGKSFFERQEGEGMDQKELELIDTLSQRTPSTPQTPVSPTSASVLEKLLSPVESLNLMSPQTPGSSREEMFGIKVALSTSKKKNEHLTALLRESEANASRLDDQAKVLKDEIRRLERNEQREQALSNMEYLKNVIIKFLKVGAVEREQLIPVLCTMLKLNTDEKQFIAEYAKGDTIEQNEEKNSWSSYVYRWSSLS